MSDAVAAIRAATSADAAGVTRIVEDAYRHYIARIGRRPAPMLNDYGELISRDAVWVMEERGSIVGIVVLLPKPDHCSSTISRSLRSDRELDQVESCWLSQKRRQSSGVIPKYGSIRT
jgi:hypothetical protein